MAPVQAGDSHQVRTKPQAKDASNDDYVEVRPWHVTLTNSDDARGRI